MKYLFVVSMIIISQINAFQAKASNMSGPNCHLVHSALSADDGRTFKHINKKLMSSASVPDAVKFKGKNLVYYVNGDFDKHSIHVAEITNNGQAIKDLGPIKLNGQIIKDAVDPDLLVTEDDKLRLFYYVGLFTKPVTNPKPNKFYSATSSDGLNFSIEGVVASLDDATDPSVTILKNGTYLMAIARNKENKIQFFRSNDGYNFKKSNIIKGGIPELSVNSRGQPNLLFQDQGGFILKSSDNDGKTWKTVKQSVIAGVPKGSASPSLLRINENEVLMLYVSAKKGCTTPPTAYLADKNALKPKGHKNQATGEPPLGHGVNPDKKKKKKKKKKDN